MTIDDVAPILFASLRRMDDEATSSTPKGNPTGLCDYEEITTLVDIAGLSSWSQRAGSWESTTRPNQRVRVWLWVRPV